MNFPFVTERASDYAEKVDPMFYMLLFLTIFFTVTVLSFLLFLTIRYRASNKKVNRSGRVHHSYALEATWSIIPLIMALGMFLWTAIPYASAFHPPKNALNIDVIGKRWMWHFQHSNGVRENNDLHIPVGRPISITLISQDVIHGLFIPAFRIKRDAMPGRYNQMWFTPTKTGQYHLFCTEYCGTNHSEMRGTVTVMEPRDYEAWLAAGGATVVKEHQTLEESGQNLYIQLACGSCHDADGIGRGPSLVGLYGSTVLTSKGQKIVADNEYIRNSIINPSDDIAAGYQQVMPSYKDQLTEEQILQLIAYIKSLRRGAAGNAPSGAPSAASGAGAAAPAAAKALAPPAVGSAPANNTGAATKANATGSSTGSEKAPGH